MSASHVYVLLDQFALAWVEPAVPRVTIQDLARTLTFTLDGHYAALGADALAALADGDESPTALGTLARMADRGVVTARAFVEMLGSGDVRRADVRELLWRDRLQTCFVELTGRCNERCQHCYAGSGPEVETALPQAALEHVVRDAREAGFSRLQLTGGDPLISSAVIPLARLAKEIEFPVLEVYTNALALDAPMLDALMDCGAVFAVSLYSHDATTHDAITRVPGSHARTSANVKRATARGATVRIGAVIMEHTEDHVEPLRAYCRDELGIPESRIGFDIIHEMGRGKSVPGLSLKDKPGVRGIHDDAGRAPTTDDPPPSAEELTGPDAPKSDRFLPWAGKVTIGPTGEVYPCIFNRFIVIGDVTERRLTDIVDAPELRIDAGIARDTATLDLAELWDYCTERVQCYDCRLGAAAALLTARSASPAEARASQSTTVPS